MMTTGALCPADGPRMAGFMARGAHPRHKTHCLRVDRSACPCFIDLAPHKFTTSAFLVHHLTAERFSGGMRSDRGREMEGEEEGRAKVKESESKEMSEGGERWKEREEGGECYFLWEDAALGQVRED